MRIITITFASVALLTRIASAQTPDPSTPAPAPEPTPTPAPATPTAAPAPVQDEPGSIAAAAEASAPWRFGVAPRIGAAVPTSKLGTTLAGGIEVAYLTAAAGHRVVIAVDLSLARPSYSSSVMDPRIPGGTTTYTIRETELVVGATVGYRLFTPAHAFVPWGAIGPVLHLLRTTEVTMLSPDSNTASSTEVGLELAAGADYRAGPGFLLGGIRLVYSNLDHRLTGDTNAGKLAVELGYRFVF